MPLYTPNPWEPGSSVSHLDDDTFTGADRLRMIAYSDLGPGIRVLSPVELAILEDLGYQVQSPGPAMAFVGLPLPRRQAPEGEGQPLSTPRSSSTSARG